MQPRRFILQAFDPGYGHPAFSTRMPSAVFFDDEAKGRVLFANEAISAYLGQTEGRLMRAKMALPSLSHQGRRRGPSGRR